MMPKARTVPAGEFKAKCLKLMDEIARDGGELIITKRGKPVARLVPPEAGSQAGEAPPKSVIGCMAGTVFTHGDIIGPFHDEWHIRDDD